MRGFSENRPVPTSRFADPETEAQQEQRVCPSHTGTVTDPEETGSRPQGHAAQGPKPQRGLGRVSGG